MPKNRIRSRVKTKTQTKEEVEVKEEPLSPLQAEGKHLNIPASRADDSTEYLIPVRAPRTKQTNPLAGSKNIVKNYGKQMASFCCSALAMPYLVPLASVHKVQSSKFMEWIGEAKASIDSITALRNLLLVLPHDESDVKAFKKMFQRLGEIFIKYFSVNWIFSGKMADRMAHLKFRFKMLRRIKNPELFTYLKQSTKA